MKAKKQITYLCGTCGVEYDYEMDADFCCAEDSLEKIKWKCSLCGRLFKTEQDANECCANKKLIVVEGIEA